MDPTDIINYWFGQISEEDCWTKGELLDEAITERFGDVHREAVAGELWEWRNNAEGRLAEIIVLDQFSRHIHRGTANAYAADPMALALAQTAVQCRADQPVEENKRLFFYMPMMHSESLKVHHMAYDLFVKRGQSLDHEEEHLRVIERFGRYPHRNAVLNRESTPEELAFLHNRERPAFAN